VRFAIRLSLVCSGRGGWGISPLTQFGEEGRDGGDDGGHPPDHSSIHESSSTQRDLLFGALKFFFKGGSTVSLIFLA
jgi:hypothetical protein